MKFTITSLFFILALILDFIVRSNYLGVSIKNIYLKFINKSYFTIYLFLFAFNFVLLTLLGYFDISLFNLVEFESFKFEENKILCENADLTTSNSSTYSYTVESSNNTPNQSSNNSNVNVNSAVTGTVNDGTLNINTPQIHLKIPSEGVNSMAAAASSAGGAAIGFKVAQQISGPPAMRIAAGLLVLAGIQASTLLMSKVLNSSNNNSNSNSYVGNIFSNSNSDLLNNKFPDFPLNLLVEVNQLINVELLFLIIILNIHIVKYLQQIDYNKYLPNNKFGKFLSLILNRYVYLWNISSNFILVISWFMLFYCVIFLKIAMFYIFNTN
jgi:hypothetical protein